MTKKKNKSKQQSTARPERIVYESNSSQDNINNTNKNNKTNNKNKSKRQVSNLYKLYDKEIIDQEQYASGERLALDYEISFRNKCTTPITDEVKIQKSNKINNEFYVIQNLNSWDRYNKAISSIEDLNTREIVRQFCIEGKTFTEIDKGLKKQGVAEVRLWYGLKELARFYTNNKNKNKI